MESSLALEFKHLGQILELGDQHPAGFAEILKILESLKDPFYATTYLERGKILSPAEMFVLAQVCLCANRLYRIQKMTDFSRWPKKVIPPPLDEMETLLAPGSRGQPSFYVSDDYSSRLKEVRMLRRQKQGAWRREMGALARKVAEALGRQPGLNEELAFQKADLSTVKRALSMSELRQTKETVSHVYFRLKATDRVLELEREINGLRVKEAEEEKRVLEVLSKGLQRHLRDFKKAVQALGELDFLISKARLARTMNAVKPEVVAPRDEGEPGSCCEAKSFDLVLEKARHPLIQAKVRASGKRYQPISIRVDSLVSVITGPNMGGKTVTLATVGLCVAMAQWGLMVPCRRLRFRLYDFVHFKAHEKGAPGLSSFAAEVVSLKELFSRRDQRGLLLLDEVGRGTNPSQGLALYAAFLHFYQKGDASNSTVLATTHYQGLAEMLKVSHWQVKGLSPEFPRLRDSENFGGTHAPLEEEGGLDFLKKHMDYSLQKVGPHTPVPQDAILVAEMLGLNKDIIKKAMEFHASDLRAEVGEVKPRTDAKTKPRRKSSP